MLGGDVERGCLKGLLGYSMCPLHWKPSYLESISGSLHVPIEGRVTIEEKHNQKHVENAARAYLERIRNRMQKPIEGLLAKRLRALNKGGGYSHRAQQTSIFMLETFIYTLNNAKA